MDAAVSVAGYLRQRVDRLIRLTEFNTGLSESQTGGRVGWRQIDQLREVGRRSRGVARCHFVQSEISHRGGVGWIQLERLKEVAVPLVAAVFRALNGKSWWKGVYWWKAFSSGQGARPDDRGYNVLGPPSEKAIAEGFSAIPRRSR